MSHAGVASQKCATLPPFERYGLDLRPADTYLIQTTKCEPGVRENPEFLKLMLDKIRAVKGYEAVQDFSLRMLIHRDDVKGSYVHERRSEFGRKFTYVQEDSMDVSDDTTEHITFDKTLMAPFGKFQYVFDFASSATSKAARDLPPINGLLVMILLTYEDGSKELIETTLRMDRHKDMAKAQKMMIKLQNGIPVSFRTGWVWDEVNMRFSIIQTRFPGAVVKETSPAFRLFVDMCDDDVNPVQKLFASAQFRSKITKRRLGRPDIPEPPRKAARRDIFTGPTSDFARAFAGWNEGDVDQSFTRYFSHGVPESTSPTLASPESAGLNVPRIEHIHPTEGHIFTGATIRRLLIGANFPLDRSRYSCELVLEEQVYSVPQIFLFDDPETNLDDPHHCQVALQFPAECVPGVYRVGITWTSGALITTAVNYTIGTALTRATPTVDYPLVAYFAQAHAPAQYEPEIAAVEAQLAPEHAQVHVHAHGDHAHGDHAHSDHAHGDHAHAEQEEPDEHNGGGDHYLNESAGYYDSPF